MAACFLIGKVEDRGNEDSDLLLVYRKQQKHASGKRLRDLRGMAACFLIGKVEDRGNQDPELL